MVLEIASWEGTFRLIGRIAFLYNNGRKYVMATTLGFVEFLVEWYFLPHTKVISITTYAGIAPHIPEYFV